MATFWEAVQSLTGLRTPSTEIERLAKHLANTFPLPLFVIDVERDRFVWVSPGTLTLTGLSPQELLSVPAYAFLEAHLVPFERFHQLWYERQKEAEVEASYRVGTEIRFVQGYWMQVEPSTFVLVLQDVTELRRAQEELAQYAEELSQQVDTLTQLKNSLQKANEELQASREQLRLLAAVAAHTDNAVVITDAQGRALWVNRGFERLTGYTLEEVKGQVPGRLLQGPNTDPETVARIREKLRKKEPFTEEILNYAKDGRPYWIRLYITPLTNELNEVTHFMAIELDITAEKARLLQLEAQLRDIQEARRYAERIFRRFLRPIEGLKPYFREAVVWNAPVAGVGGDFYFYAPQEGAVLLALGDSTGHGAAAALLSVYALTSLWRSTRQPVHNLTELYEDLLEGLLTSGEGQVGAEGFELALLQYEPAAQRLVYLGARRPLWVFRGGQLHEVRGSRSDVSPTATTQPTPQSLRLEPGDRLYLFTDGLTDQLNPQGKKFTPARLARLLEVNQYLSLPEQLALLQEAHTQWRGNNPQTDDILFLALEV